MARLYERQGAAIYLLTESNAGDAQHERYNLIRIMNLLLDNADQSMEKIFCELYKALCDWDPKGREITDKKGTRTRGLLIEKKLVKNWKIGLEEKIPNLKGDT